MWGVLSVVYISVILFILEGQISQYIVSVRGSVTNNIGFWIWWLNLLDTYTFTQFGTTGNFSAIAILYTFQLTITHALGFPVFTSRILATDLSQSHYNFKSHMKPSWHCLIPFFTFVQLPIPRLLSTTTNNPTDRQSSSYNHFARTMNRKHMPRERMLGADHIENTAHIIALKREGV
jgi:hypothetical protein